MMVTPAPAHSRTGNRVTAIRWARILRQLGHRVTIRESYQRQSCDLLVALHARKSARAMEQFRREYPLRPVVLALTGTDLYDDLLTSRTAQQSVEHASRLVLLQPHGRHQLSDDVQAKIRVIYQSAKPPARPVPKLQTAFELNVTGHLRPVKDPLRAEMASRTLPAESKIRITHTGAALSDALGRRAERQTRQNPRYRWWGEQPRWRARRLLARSRVMLLTSKLEGGANVVSEALAADVPVISTRISGSLGLLGDDYPGYFNVGATDELAALMRRCECDRAFYRSLRSACRARKTLVHPRRERQAWRALINELAY